MLLALDALATVSAHENICHFLEWTLRESGTTKFNFVYANFDQQWDNEQAKMKRRKKKLVENDYRMRKRIEAIVL